MNTANVLFFLAFALCVTAIEEGWLQTPGGKLVWHECAFEVPSGSHVEDSESNNEIIVHLPDGGIQRLPRCQHRYRERKERSVNVQGWQVWAQYNAIQNKTFTAMTNYFTVPAAPLEWPTIPGVGIIYIFPGLQNDDWVPVGNSNDAPPSFDIIQPVLQYGSGSANGGGRRWEVANWYVTLDDSAVWTAPTIVQDGDNVYGEMLKTDDETWYIGANFSNGDVNGFYVSRPRLAVQNWAFVTLEVYNVFDCSHFPTKTDSLFTKLQLLNENGQVEEAKWDAFYGTNECGSDIKVSDPQTVDIIFP